MHNGSLFCTERVLLPLTGADLFYSHYLFPIVRHNTIPKCCCLTLSLMLTSTSPLARSRLTISVCPFVQAKWKLVMPWKSVNAVTSALLFCSHPLYSIVSHNIILQNVVDVLYPSKWHPHHFWLEVDWLSRCVHSHKHNESLFFPEWMLLLVTRCWFVLFSLSMFDCET